MWRWGEAISWSSKQRPAVCQKLPEAVKLSSFQLLQPDEDLVFNRRRWVKIKLPWTYGSEVLRYQG